MKTSSYPRQLWIASATVLAGALAMAGCHTQTAHPDEKSAVSTSLNSNNLSAVSVTQDRDKGVMTLTGAWDAATNSITFTGTMVDPASAKDVPIREVFKMTDDNHQTLEMYANMGGQEFKTMEIKFTRK